MDLIEAIDQQHSVRSYLVQPLDDETAEQLNEVIRECNEEGGLHIQLVRNDPSAFSSGLAKYGQFSNVTDYIALIGKKSSDLEEKAGYYGEKIVLAAQRLGLNTCWVALTFRKNPDAYTVSAGEKLVMVIAVGHGAVQGVPHKSKEAEKLAELKADDPEWYLRGIACALKAPTAMNQQKFRISRKGNTVSIRSGLGIHTKTDTGIVRYHFEIGAGKENFEWE